MQTFFVDSNIFLRFIVQDNEKQAREAERIFDLAKQGQLKLIIIPEIIMEVDYVLNSVYKTPKQDLVNYLLRIVRTPYFEIKQRAELIAALGVYGQVNIDLVDVFLYFSAKLEDARVLSFDKDFVKLEKLEK